MSKDIDWSEKLLKDSYYECSNVGLSYEELYQAIKERLINEFGATSQGILKQIKEQGE